MGTEKPLRYGKRADIRDRILSVLADGKQRHISEITKELNWTKTTNVSKTIAEIKSSLVINRDSRRLHRVKFDNCRKGTVWYLTNEN
jgi:predicted transcriptional regulator